MAIFLKFWPEKIKEAVITLKSNMQFTKTNFPDFAIVIEKKKVENLLWGKVNFCGEYTYISCDAPTPRPSLLRSRRRAPAASKHNSVCISLILVAVCIVLRFAEQARFGHVIGQG